MRSEMVVVVDEKVEEKKEARVKEREERRLIGGDKRKGEI